MKFFTMTALVLFPLLSNASDLGLVITLKNNLATLTCNIAQDITNGDRIEAPASEWQCFNSNDELIITGGDAAYASFVGNSYDSAAEINYSIEPDNFLGELISTHMQMPIDEKVNLIFFIDQASTSSQEIMIGNRVLKVSVKRFN